MTKTYARKTLLLTPAALLVVGFAAVVAQAGFKSTSEVYVSTASRYAYGSLGSARNSADATQHIGCSVWAFAAGTSTVFCYARNSAGTSVTCSSTASALVNVVHALNGDSHLYFDYDEAGKCYEIDVHNRSQHATKNH